MSNPTEDQLTEELIKVKYKCYRAYLRTLDEEFLGYEFADRIGDEDNGFDWLMNHGGRGAVIDKLEDWCANVLYDDPMFHPVNHEYLKACEPKIY